jgi:hypothetical protein
MVPSRLTPIFFAAQLANVGDFFPGHPNVGLEIVPAIKGDDVRALQMAGKETRGRARHGMNIAGNQRLISRRRAVDSNRLDGQALFSEKALSLATSTGKAAVGNNGIATRMVSWTGTPGTPNAKRKTIQVSKAVIIMQTARVGTPAIRCRYRLRPTRNNFDHLIVSFAMVARRHSGSFGLRT